MDEERFGKFGLTVVTSGVWASLTYKAKAVYAVLVVYARSANRQAWPSNKRLAKEAGINIRSIPASTAELEKAGLVKKWRHDRRNYYYLRKNGFTMSPPAMDTKTPRITLRRPRDKRGHFIAPSRTDQQNPPQMDRSTPPQMDSVPPSQMDKKKRDLNREIEGEIFKKTSDGQAQASPSPENKDKGTARDEKQDVGQLASYFVKVEPGEWERHARILEKQGYPLEIIKEAKNIAAGIALSPIVPE